MISFFFFKNCVPVSEGKSRFETKMLSGTIAFGIISPTPTSVFHKCIFMKYTKSPILGLKD